LSVISTYCYSRRCSRYNARTSTRTNTAAVLHPRACSFCLIFWRSVCVCLRSLCSVCVCIALYCVSAVVCMRNKCTQQVRGMTCAGISGAQQMRQYLPESSRKQVFAVNTEPQKAQCAGWNREGGLNNCSMRNTLVPLFYSKSKHAFATFHSTISLLFFRRSTTPCAAISRSAVRKAFVAISRGASSCMDRTHEIPYIIRNENKPIVDRDIHRHTSMRSME
jgi:hypothetical protein